ncbi:MAG TPA: hypothetical protein VGL93_32540 [Streptosporangiaceae bacterium]
MDDEDDGGVFEAERFGLVGGDVRDPGDVDLDGLAVGAVVEGVADPYEGARGDVDAGSGSAHDVPASLDGAGVALLAQQRGRLLRGDP